jgi:acyl-CoA synthetase (AMP-forming)/AMP-acid ligase II
MSHPKKLIVDVSAAGVSGGRTEDEKIPRAWIVLSEVGKALGTAETIKQLEEWHQENLSRYKWLRGGIEVVNEVIYEFSHLFFCLILIFFPVQIPKLPSGKTLRRVLQEQYEKRVSQARQSKL